MIAVGVGNCNQRHLYLIKDTSKALDRREIKNVRLRRKLKKRLTEEQRKKRFIEYKYINFYYIILHVIASRIPPGQAELLNSGNPTNPRNPGDPTNPTNPKNPRKPRMQQ